VLIFGRSVYREVPENGIAGGVVLVRDLRLITEEAIAGETQVLDRN
jgi:hypothetical protein